MFQPRGVLAPTIVSAVSISPRWVQRTYAAMLVWAVVAANLAGFAHEASVKHVRCEHGDMVHVDGVAGTPVHPSNTATYDGTAQEKHDHQHCGMIGATRQLAASTDRAAEICAVVHRSIPDPTHHAAIASRSALYRTAPKTSPPG